MMVFMPRSIADLTAMYEVVGSGGLVLYHHPGHKVVNPSAPKCFRRSNGTGWLMAIDKMELLDTATRLGVKRIQVDRKQRKGIGEYYVTYLCGRPLEKAVNRGAKKTTRTLCLVGTEENI